MRRRIGLGFLALLSPVVAQADAGAQAEPAHCGIDLQVRFIEGAPVDRFIITNGSDVAYPVTEVVFDLTASQGRLIFDTQSGGSGVDVFQPFVSDAAQIDVQDGATGLRFPMQGLKAGAEMSFTIDVDDQLITSELGQIRVSGAEIAGAHVTFSVGTQTYLAVFDDKSIAGIAPTCSGTA